MAQLGISDSEHDRLDKELDDRIKANIQNLNEMGTELGYDFTEVRMPEREHSNTLV